MNPHDRAYQDQVDADGHDLYAREREDRCLDFTPGVVFPPAARGGNTNDDPPTKGEVVGFVCLIVAVYALAAFGVFGVFA